MIFVLMKCVLMLYQKFTFLVISVFLLITVSVKIIKRSSYDFVINFVFSLHANRDPVPYDGHMFEQLSAM